MLIGQVGYGVCYACAPALYADTAVYAEWKTGKSNVGWIMGLQNVPLKVGVILRGIVVAASLAAANFDAKIDPAKATVELKKGVTAAFALWPAIFVAFGFLLLLFGYKLSRETVSKYQAEIDARS
jgi:GPH family glycoside/pentoside/hexuronide:cation symporter